MQTLTKRTVHDIDRSYDKKININLPSNPIQPFNQHANLPRRTANLILKIAAGVGADIGAIFAAEGVGNFSGKIEETRFSSAQFFNIFRKLGTVIADDAHRETGYFIQNFDEDLFYSCIMNGKNLEDVIDKSVKFCNSMNGSPRRLSLEIDGQNAILHVASRLRKNEIRAVLTDMLGLSYYYKLFSWMIAESICPIEVTLVHDELIDREIVGENIDCPVHFNGRSNAIVFNRKFLQKPVLRTYHELYDSLVTRHFELTPFPPTTSTATYIENLFRKILATKSPIPNSDQIASALGKSGQTLRRHLAMENTSFQYLLDKCRIEKSIELLEQTDLTLDEISELLGFSAGSGFSRAFKNWTGYSPSVFRLQSRGSLVNLKPDALRAGAAPAPQNS